jgi:3D (Asp-Asp-Asp) domain-containing protein
MNTTLRTLVLGASTLAFLAVGAGCAGATVGGDEAELHPGHGMASRSWDLDSGDHTNPYDTTDDPSDPSFVPQPQPLKPWAGGVGRSAEALSTTTGTTFALTYYDVSLRPSGDASETTLRDCDGNFLTKASYTWRDDAVMQGTARFHDASGSLVTINDGGGCWVKLSYAQRWGLGVENPATGNAFELRVFRSIAVDPSVMTIGKWYYIKQLDGVVMPSPASGLLHDGCVRAMDVGPAIVGKHIDFFVGYYSAYQSLINGSSTMGGRESVTVYDGAAKCGLHISRGY